MNPHVSSPASVALWSVAALTGAIVWGALATWLALDFLRARHRQAAREDLPERHATEKAGTPSMGGLGLVPALITGSLFAVIAFRQIAPSANGGIGRLVPWLLAMVAVYGVLGFLDDYTKTKNPKAKGLRPRYRLPVEIAAAVGFTLLVGNLAAQAGWHHHLPWPVPGRALPHWVAWYSIPLGVFAIVGAANAVNLTDGLDGLAGGNVAFCALGLAGMNLAQHRPEMAACSLVLAGVATGFLWFNANPAQIWMGDTGALALGAALGGIAVASGLEIVLGLAGLVFVWETLSVIIQVIYFQSTGGKRLFRMSPFHHHLELSGWPENHIVLRSWLITAGCSLLAWVCVAGQV
jgi:phospho-N-acetylmuramoyl-pentapeptide-transferase